MRSTSELRSLFREKGLKLTPQRQCIFAVLESSEGSHPTAEAVHEAARREMPNLSLRTVYQTLHDLAEMGELLELDLGTGSVRFDTMVEPHHHLVCRACGKVLDLPSAVGEVSIPEGMDAGFAVDGVEITFRGTCPACAPTAQHRSPTP